MDLKMYNLANKYFNKFINDNFDINDEKISHKVKHTYQVVNNAKYICEKLKLDSLNTDIAMIIALLHDIGRFTQAKEMKTFREDITNYDHATLGVKLLFEKNEIRKYINNNEYICEIYYFDDLKKLLEIIVNIFLMKLD